VHYIVNILVSIDDPIVFLINYSHFTLRLLDYFITEMSLELVPTSDRDIESFADLENRSESKVDYDVVNVANAPVKLQWKNLGVKTRSVKESLQYSLLSDVSGSITGGFWAIMGASGSGTFSLSSASYYTTF
jgi:hypothetical protein